MSDYAIRYIGQTVRIVIDGRLGSKHKDHDIWFCTNYGYVPGTKAPDNDDVDAYLLGVFTPVEEYTGKCIAVIRRHDDDDDKLIVVPDDVTYTEDQIVELTEYIERFHSIEVMV